MTLKDKLLAIEKSSDTSNNVKMYETINQLRINNDLDLKLILLVSLGFRWRKWVWGEQTPQTRGETQMDGEEWTLLQYLFIVLCSFNNLIQTKSTFNNHLNMWESSLKQDGNFGNFLNIWICCGSPAGYILLNVFHGVLRHRLMLSPLNSLWHLWFLLCRLNWYTAGFLYHVITKLYSESYYWNIRLSHAPSGRKTLIKMSWTYWAIM